MQTTQTVVKATKNPAQAPTQAPQPITSNALGQFALYAQAQAQKAQQQAQRVAQATYLLVKPSKANLARPIAGASPAQQAQTNANFAATLILQLYPLAQQSGLTQAQQAQVNHALLQATYTLQQAANIAPSKQAVTQVLP